MELPHAKEKTRPTETERVAQHERNTLYRRTWRNWFFLAGVLLLTTIGLATSIPPLLSERITRLWPWGKTDLVLLVGLSLTVLAFVTYLTQQQREVLRIHMKLQRIKDEHQTRLQQNTGRLYALASISRIMGTETDLESIFQSITMICAETFNCYRASLMLLDKDKNELAVRSVCGHYDDRMLDIRLKVGDGIAGWAAAHNKPILICGPEDCKKYPDLKFVNPSLTSTMVVPIFVRGELVGVINVTSKSPDISYDDEDLRALQVFAENAGMCIRHAEQVHWLRQMIPHQVDAPRKRMGQPATRK